MSSWHAMVSKCPTEEFVNYSACAIRNPNALEHSNYTHFAGLLKVNKLFCNDAKLLTPECCALAEHIKIDEIYNKHAT